MKILSKYIDYFIFVIFLLISVIWFLSQKSSPSFKYSQFFPYNSVAIFYHFKVIYVHILCNPSF